MEAWSKRLTVPDVVSDEDMSSGGQNHTRDSERPPGTRRIALAGYITTQSPGIMESERHARDLLSPSLFLNPAEARKTCVKLYSINLTKN